MGGEKKKGWQRLTDSWEERKAETRILAENKSFGYYIMTKRKEATEEIGGVN